LGDAAYRRDNDSTLCEDGHRFGQSRVTTDGVAKQLQISMPTVREHISNAIAKLGAKDRTHAVAEAMRQGLLPGQENGRYRPRRKPIGSRPQPDERAEG
jgi:hypothetical protein